MGSVFDIWAKDSPDDISLYILDYLYNMQDNIRQWTYAFLEGCAPRFGLTSDCCDNLRRSNVVVGKLHYNFIHNNTYTIRAIDKHILDIDH